MDPISLFSLIGLCGTISCRIVHIDTNLNGLRDRYKNTWLAMESLDSQVAAIQTATARLASWLENLNPAFSEDEYSGLKKSLTACENVLNALQEHVGGVKQGPERFSLRGKSRYMWNEGNIRKFRGLLQCQVQALSFHLQVLSLPSQADRHARLESKEGQQILNTAFDGASSLFGIKDSSSAYSFQSNSTTRSCASKLSAIFSFDLEVLNSKAYRAALSSLMRNCPAVQYKGNLVEPSNVFASEGKKQLSYPKTQSTHRGFASPYNMGNSFSETEVATQRPKPLEKGKGYHGALRASNQCTRPLYFNKAPERLSETTQIHLAILDRHIAQSIKSENAQRTENLLCNPSNPSFPPKWFSWSLRQAIDQEAIIVLRRMIQYGFDIEAVDGFMRTPLYYACSKGLVMAVEFLLDQDASIEAANFIGERPLHAACFTGHSVIVQRLLNRGANADSANIRGETPLHYACLWGEPTVALTLTARGANIWAANHEGETPLHYAISNAHPYIVSLLVSASPCAPPTDNSDKAYFDFLIRELSREERRIISLNREDRRFTHILKTASGRLRKLVQCVELLVELPWEGHTYAQYRFRRSILFSLSLPHDRLGLHKRAASRKSTKPTKRTVQSIPGGEPTAPKRPPGSTESIPWRITPRELTDWVESTTDEDLYTCLTRLKHGRIKDNDIITNAVFASSSRARRALPSNLLMNNGLKVETSVNVSIDVLPNTEAIEQHEGDIKHIPTDGYVQQSSPETTTENTRSRSKLSTIQQNILNGRLCSAVGLNEMGAIEDLLVCGADPNIILGSPSFLEHCSNQNREDIRSLLSKYSSSAVQ